MNLWFILVFFQTFAFPIPKIPLFQSSTEVLANMKRGGLYLKKMLECKPEVSVNY